jgi:hypothetical protein
MNQLKTILLKTIEWIFRGFFILLYTLVFSVFFIIIAGMGYGMVKETIKHFNPPPAEELTD